MVSAVGGIVFKALETTIVEEVRAALARRNTIERLLLREVAERVDGMTVWPAYARTTAAPQRISRLACARARPSTTITTGLSFRDGHHPFLAPINIILERLVDVALRQRAERRHTRPT